MVSSEVIYVSPQTKKDLFDDRKFGEDYDATIIRIMKEAKELRLKK